jgi:hypothetical protein
MRKQVKRALVMLAMMGVAAPSALAGPTKQDVINGAPVPPSEMPYAAYVYWLTPDNQRFFACTASVISPDWVLTAAHCLWDATYGTAQPARLRVAITHRVPDRDPSGFPQGALGVSQAILHPSWPRNNDHIHPYDAALLNLASPAPAHAQARLPRPGDGTWGVGSSGAAAGFGLTRLGDPNSASRDLLWTGAAVRPDSSCRVQHAPTQLCGQPEPTRSTCSGDSGGPLALDVGVGQDVVVGALSGSAFATTHCLGGSFSVWAKVGAEPLNSWIRSFVPLEEIDLDPPNPAPGERVTLRANPAASHFSSWRWDLDNDGQYDDATGATSSITMPDGRVVVGLQASSGGRTWTRRAAFASQRSPLALTASSYSVGEGKPIQIGVTKAGRGSGAIATTVTPISARPGQDYTPVQPGATLGAGDSGTTLSIPTVDDLRRTGPRLLRVGLGTTSATLALSPPTQASVTILDDDVVTFSVGSVRAVRGRRGRAEMRMIVAVPEPGTVRASVFRVRRGADKRLATGSFSRSRGGPLGLRVRLSRKESRLIRRKRRAYRIVTTMSSADGATGRITRTVRLRARR